jgi:thioredoxin reductase
VIIIGGGPAGLSAALMLGRCRRRVLLCDAGKPRNAASHGLHGFLTRDGILPLELLRIAREQLRPYACVEVRDVEIVDARRVDGGFEVALGDGSRHSARRLLLATGVVDQTPQIEGLQALYGRSVFHCPYCDGWEVRDQPLAVYGKGEAGLGLALGLTQWSRDLVLCTDGPSALDEKDRKRLDRLNIGVREERVVRLEGADGILERIVFANGDVISRRALFFNTGQYQRSALGEKLGCAFTDEGCIWVDKHEATNVPGVYVAGDASHDAQFAVVAAAEGVQAAETINSALLKEDLAELED